MAKRTADGNRKDVAGAVSPEGGRKHPVSSSSRDDLFGKGIMSFVALLILAGTAFFILLGYRIMQNRDDSRESIATLVPVREQPAVESAPNEPAAEEPIPSKEPDKSAVQVIVMNGGSVAGSAAKATNILKNAGYSKAETGNADGNYTGVTVFYATDAQQSAQLVRDALLATYKNAIISPEDTKKPETGKAPIVVILGK
ncbi:MAG: LytR C-terminal domain-containing protein [Candidatus Moranbacteria bacterium]|nr:LytR C-terminal domain-containing protein [Candidatus Moranbacteria bacterium]